MPVYDITVTPDPIFEQKYRIEADSLEEAREAAADLFYEQAGDLVSFEVEGELSDDQQEPVDFSTKDVD